MVLTDGVQLTPSTKVGDHNAQIVLEGMQQFLNSHLKVLVEQLFLTYMDGGKLFGFQQILSHCCDISKIKCMSGI